MTTKPPPTPSEAMPVAWINPHDLENMDTTQVTLFSTHADGDVALYLHPSPAPLVGVREKAQALLDLYIRLVECGDCGNWNPHEEPEVIALKAALITQPAAQAEGVVQPVVDNCTNFRREWRNDKGVVTEWYALDAIEQWIKQGKKIQPWGYFPDLIAASNPTADSHETKGRE